MPGYESDPVVARLRRALGRGGRRRSLPVPPTIAEPIVRLVHAEIGLAELFVATANGIGVHAELIHADDVAGALAADLRAARADRVAIEPAPLLQRLGVPGAIAADAFAISESHAGGVQVAVPYAAVAETGTVIFRGGPDRGGADRGGASQLFLVIEPRCLVADLLDLFQRLSDEPQTRSVLMLSGGPPTVRAYVLH